jgi:hypothetical protein
MMHPARAAHNNAGLAATLHPALRGSASNQPGRFIWQLVGVLDTYGSICLIGTNV